MQRLYCPECGNYLLVGSGEHIDCSCGWKQYRPPEQQEEEEE